jgi:hypothetical protein
MIACSAMRTIQMSIVALTMLALCSCGFSHEEQMDGPYYLIAVDATDEMDVSYKVNDDGSYVGRIPAGRSARADAPAVTCLTSSSSASTQKVLREARMRLPVVVLLPDYWSSRMR